MGTDRDWGCCTYSYPCREKGGDCDSDYHCEGSLVCGADNCQSIHRYAQPYADYCVKPGKADCDCDYWYSNGGCQISKAAPPGYKCYCSYRGFWTCSGWATQCESYESCPGYCSTSTCCNQGGGDCDG